MRLIPQPFPGSADQIERNKRTHDWAYAEDGPRCNACDARPSQEAAKYPCGTPVPMIDLDADHCHHQWQDGWGYHDCFVLTGHSGPHRCKCDATARRTS